MERIQNLHFDMPETDIADDEAYHIIIDCIKSHNRAIKLVYSFSVLFLYVAHCLMQFDMRKKIYI